MVFRVMQIADSSLLIYQFWYNPIDRMAVVDEDYIVVNGLDSFGKAVIGLEVDEVTETFFVEGELMYFQVGVRLDD